MIIRAEGPFDYALNYEFMAQQDDCLYRTGGNAVRKAVSLDGNRVLLEVKEGPEDAVRVDILVNEGALESDIERYVTEWLDLDYDMTAFYDFASGDQRLAAIVQELYGYRMICTLDMMEALTWSILGQQINMKFAFILKRRLVEHFNHHIEFEGEKYWLMPAAGELLSLDVELMREMQISYRKAEYLHRCAKGIETGTLSKDHLQRIGSYQDVLDHLTSVKGIGPWSANSVLMRTLKFRNAVPIGDAGLKNAIRITDRLEEKPSPGYIRSVTDGWGDNGAYATLYMWRILG
ncbi:DNA-3-methyladenine glycosylase family protein [Salinicoccus hispanicus]|uniref:DNA-3-methyladenine glycosylase II n=1 Tax=Salinicoccus hispanicus TaxID=157225 RepID=A0A6N8U6M1_9STAP|nr:DNA-3-methyladenine glycosylase 2 family protein [Salinicoccus hispanicus]MXQ51971.1 DNA-3-methyladenine glycosylase 2 family protein [Salinicoccus hispanicus]